MPTFSLRAKAILLLSVLAFITPTVSAYYPSVPALAVEEALKSPSAILIHPGTGTILIAKNEHEPRYIASVTKVMTMLLVLEAIESQRITWDDEVTGSSHASSRGGSQIWLEPGERLTVEELFLTVAVVSANDSAVALAEFVAGSEEGFVALMNERAKQLGCLNTSFKNACGLDVEGHLSSAYDVALMSQELLKHPKIHEFTTIQHTTLPREATPEPSDLTNTNRDMLRTYTGCDGLKTGKTNNSGWCLSATAKRGDLRLVAVVLGAETVADRKGDIVKLLDYGFANYQARSFVRKGEEVGIARVSKGVDNKVPALPGDDLTILLPKGTNDDLETRVVYTPTEAPVRAGQVVGQLGVYRGEEEIASVELVAGQAVPRAPLWMFLIRLWEALY